MLIQQLNGVRDPKGGSFSRYFYLLERLAMVPAPARLLHLRRARRPTPARPPRAQVKSFVLMIDLECQDLIESLFEVLFDVTSKEHGVRVEGFLLEILVGIIEDLDAVPPPDTAELWRSVPSHRRWPVSQVPQPLLDVVLEKVVQPAKAETPRPCGAARVEPRLSRAPPGQ